MSEMIDRVAEAIRLRAIERGHPAHPAMVRHMAAAAIEAMREPTQEMQTKGRIMAALCVAHEATDEYSAEVTDDAAINIWQEMLDAALSQNVSRSNS